MTTVVGVGVDLVETVRVKRLLERYPERFIQKLMDPEEARQLPAAGPERVSALAQAIAGKEAASKALGTGWSRGVFWRDVVVTRVPAAAVELKGGAAQMARERGSDGRCRARLGTEGPLTIGEVWLLR